MRRHCMSKPFIFIGTHQIAEGKLDEFKRDCQQLVEVVERNEPQLLSFNFYFSEDEGEVSVVQVHPDADSMLLHMQVAREHIAEAAEEQLVTKDIQIFGPPNDAVLGMIEQLSQSGVPLIVKPKHLAGFTRATGVAEKS
jgi:quinol monooxygenase YgiN